MQAPSGVAKFCIASLAISPQLPLAMQARGHVACGGGFMQLMLNCEQKSKPHIEALSQALSQALTPPVAADALGPGPTDTATSIVEPVVIGPPVVAAAVAGPVI